MKKSGGNNNAGISSHPESDTGSIIQQPDLSRYPRYTGDWGLFRPPHSRVGVGVGTRTK